MLSCIAAAAGSRLLLLYGKSASSSSSRWFCSSMRCGGLLGPQRQHVLCIMHPCVIASRAAQPHNRVQCITMYLWLSSVVRSKDQPRVTQLSDQLQCSMRECRLSKSQTDHSCGGGCRADDV